MIRELLLLTMFFAVSLTGLFAQDFQPNYDESLVPDYELPDPLVSRDGTPVVTQKDWLGKRRLEVLQLFEEHMYGKTPGDQIPTATLVQEVDSLALGGMAIRKQIRLQFTEEPDGPHMDLLVYLPTGRTGPVPIFVGLNFYGNHTIHLDPEILLTSNWVRNNTDYGITKHKATEASRGVRANRWPVERILARGYGLATAYYGDIDPDDDGDFQNGVHPLFYGGKRSKPGPNEWGAIGAWAWGLSRAMDYFETDDDIDHERVSVMGHSRLGKTSLWAGAQDPRFALVISNNSGCGGAALSRRAFGETVARINDQFPHWFSDTFTEYNDNEAALPVDQHMLIALMAPRPVYIASAADDRWADPHGEFLAAKHANPVYKLFGLEGLPAGEMPPVNTPVKGTVGYHIREGGHDVTNYDWDRFMDFADSHLSAPDKYKYPFQNPDLGIEERVDDLVGRLSLEEKVAQMRDSAPAIERLDIPEYNWWNEALHGVARAGLATSYPQAIGLAATWNEPLMYQMATAISDEARAKHHEFARKGKRFRYQGLTIWSPNINIFRDPRWGRGQETYGEDPFLSGRLGVQFVRGLQGEDAKYLKTVATVKHYAVHNGPEPERHVFDAVVSPRDLRETYLPQFERTIRDAGAYSLMCAYNRVDGEAACSHSVLLKDILRDEWEFPGFIVSDCWAINDIYMNHKLVDTAAEAAAVAVKAGTDLECGSDAYLSLVEAVEKGHITEAEIDVSVKRLFTARIKLGMLDPEERVSYAQIPYDAVDNEEHRELARNVARESMVLLKNEGGTLPLSRALDTLAVIGPNADQWLMLLGNYNGVPSEIVTPLQGIQNAVGGNTQVLYAQGSEPADGLPIYDVIPEDVLFGEDGRPGLQVEYFAGETMDGEPLFTDVDPVLDANWHDGAPRGDMDDDSFGVRWTGVLRPAVTGVHELGVIGTMRFWLYLDDQLQAESRYHQDDEYADPRLRKARPMTLEAGKEYRLRVDAVETYADAQVQLVWAPPRGDLLAEAVHVAEKADAVVLFLGLTPRLEGEEMPIEIEGFRGGDRTRIDLPQPQQHLMQKIVELGKPTVLVLLNGSALAVPWAHENIPAILEAWYPGQAAGTAIADVLFGDYNPGGRLPVTFYKSVDDLPPFEDYNMVNRTYRFFEGEALYPFGHGLSYTTFTYDDMRVGSPTVRSGETIRVEVDITNDGPIEGDEVAQLYVSFPESKVVRPIRDLRGFERVRLIPAETKTVTFEVPVSEMAYWDEDENQWVVEPGVVELQVGASSADIRQRTEVEVVP